MYRTEISGNNTVINITAINIILYIWQHQQDRFLALCRTTSDIFLCFYNDFHPDVRENTAARYCACAQKLLVASSRAASHLPLVSW